MKLKPSTALNVVRFGTEIGVAIGVGMIAGTAIAGVPVVAGGVAARVCVKMGALAIEAAVVDHVVDYVDEKFDAIQGRIENVQEAIIDLKPEEVEV